MDNFSNKNINFSLISAYFIMTNGNVVIIIIVCII